jgi:hypothetical protein
MKERVANAVLLFIKDPSSKQFTSREGKHAYTKQYLSKYCQNFVSLKILMKESVGNAV